MDRAEGGFVKTLFEIHPKISYCAHLLQRSLLLHHHCKNLYHNSTAKLYWALAFLCTQSMNPVTLSDGCTFLQPSLSILGHHLSLLLNNNFLVLVCPRIQLPNHCHLDCSWGSHNKSVNFLANKRNPHFVSIFSSEIKVCFEF